ncbi:hypothetical protein E3N88_03998 [Mikania micrantha]|uniref:Cyclin-like domain-containing protein n=1 Tax=Mikania micrantha TaxID=192012 RepID=A0A5N6PW09_9ASTR|nr:hypothetical protein E3N88_03998 [Mikania micrantha]
MKKLRSKLPRRKRSKCSPILRSPGVLKFDSSFVVDSSSNLTREVAFTCDSSSRVSTTTNNKSAKNRSFADGNGAVDCEFRRITRSYSKRMAIMAEKEVELSELSSCVELLNSSSKNIVRKGPADLRCEKSENDVTGIENSEVTTRSECSVFPKELTDENAYAESAASRLESHQKTGEINSFINDSVTNETLNDDKAEYCGESKLISAEFDLACSEHLTSGYEDCEYSSAECIDGNMDSSEFEFSSDWYDSGSQFSEQLVGDTTPSPTFQLFLLYRQKFCKSKFSSKLSSENNDNQPSDRVIKLLRPEDEEQEESYQMLKERERRQVYLHDYTKEYSGMKEYCDLVVQQRLQMVHWIIKQSTSKELQKETMFLGVSFLDQFLSKGYFRNKTELKIAGVACLTLATRIEETQPYNSIQQKIFKVGSNEYSRSEVVAMEWLVQEVLNFQCYLPTIYNFLWFYLKAARANQSIVKTANHLAVHALLGHEQLCYWPSTVAASLVCLACLAENKQSSHQQITWV